MAIMPDLAKYFGKWAALEHRVQELEKSISSLKKDNAEFLLKVTERLTALETSFKAEREYVDQKIENSTLRTETAASQAASQSAARAVQPFIDRLMDLTLKIERLEAQKSTIEGRAFVVHPPMLPPSGDSGE
jgi:hypothetical protein